MPVINFSEDISESKIIAPQIRGVLKPLPEVMPGL